MTQVAEVHRTRDAHPRLTTAAQFRGWKFRLCLALVALLGMVLVVCSAQVRMGMNTDGTAYYGMTKRVMAGQGPKWPYGSPEEDLDFSVHFPPLFALSAGHLSTLLGARDPRVTVTYLHGALLGACILLTGSMVRRYTGSGWWGVGGALFLLLTADVLDAYASFMSEPLFIFLIMAGLVAVDSGARRARRRVAAATILVFLGGLLIGAACWCRYAAIGFIGAAGVGLLLYPGLHWRRRLLLAAVAGVPMMLGWWGTSHYIYSITHSNMSRTVRFQPDQFVYLGPMVGFPAQWVLPLSMKSYAMVLTAAGVTGGAFALAGRLRRRERDDMEDDPRDLLVDAAASARPKSCPRPWVFASAAIVYPALMIFSAILVDPPATPLEARLLVPWLPPLIVVAAWWLNQRVQAAARRDVARAGLAVFMVAVAIGNSPRIIERLRGDEQYRIGYTSTRWQASATARWVREHVPADAVIYSNLCDALYYLTDRSGIWVPKSHLRDANRTLRADFVTEVDRMCAAMEKSNGFLVCFNDTWVEEYGMARPKEIVEAVRKGAMVPHAVTSDGTIYRWVAPMNVTSAGPRP